MSAQNGGRGTPPVPPPTHAPQQQEIPILKEVMQISQLTTAERTEEGGILSFVVIDGGQPVKHNYVVGEQGKRLILETLSGGLKLP